MFEEQGIVRVVVADDSDISAEFIAQLLERDPHLRVVGRARNGVELLELPERQIAQVVLLDILMPEMGGLSAIRMMSGNCPLIAISSERSDSAVAAEALALGASAYFCKRNLGQVTEAARLRDAVKAAARVPHAREARSVVLVVGSTGAIGVLETLVHDLEGLSIPIVIVQHLPEGREQSLARLLSFGQPARVARDGESLSPGAIVAPSGRHLIIDHQDRFRVLDSPPVKGHRPSGEILLQSAVRLGRRAIAVILSGLGNDGAEAIAALAANGAVCLAQHPHEAGASSMPKAALAASRRVKAVRSVDLGIAVKRAVQDERS